jgi:hypothetical protein
MLLVQVLDSVLLLGASRVSVRCLSRKVASFEALCVVDVWGLSSDFGSAFRFWALTAKLHVRWLVGSGGRGNTGYPTSFGGR